MHTIHTVVAKITGPLIPIINNADRYPNRALTAGDLDAIIAHHPDMAVSLRFEGGATCITAARDVDALVTAFRKTGRRLTFMTINLSNTTISTWSNFTPQTANIPAPSGLN